MKALRKGFGCGLRATLLLLASGCALGQGEGQIESDNLVVPTCWSGAYQMNPDFFAAVPYRDEMQIRVQRGSDLVEVSDGLALLINDVPAVRNAKLGEPLQVGLAPQLKNEIAPNLPVEEPDPVSLALYLQFSCHNQNVVLYGIGGSIVFNELFSGDPNESVGAEKLTDATLDVVVADPRDAAAGTLDIPEEKTSRLQGFFRFHFQRGQPSQPFP